MKIRHIIIGIFIFVLLASLMVGDSKKEDERAFRDQMTIPLHGQRQKLEDSIAFGIGWKKIISFNLRCVVESSKTAAR